MVFRQSGFFIGVIATVLFLSSCNSEEKRFASYMDSVSIADSISYAKANPVTNKTESIHFKENSLFNFPFLLNEKKDWFHHARIGKNLSIHQDDFKTDKLKSVSHEEYSRIIHDPNEKLNPTTNPFDDKWYYYSIEDTSFANFWTFTIVHAKKENDIDLFLVYMKMDGTYSDNLSVASCYEEEGFYGTPSRSRSSSRIISGTKMASDYYFESPNTDGDPNQKHSGNNFLAAIGHYHFDFTISEEGKLKQDTMITSKEKKIYSNSDRVEALFK